MQLSLLCLSIAALSDALAPTRRSALQRAAVGALSLTTAQRASAANADAEKVRQASRELNELIKDEDALRYKVLFPAERDVRALPTAVSFVTFQQLEKSCGDDMMGSAIEYVEAYRDARDLVKLAVLSRKDGGGPDA